MRSSISAVAILVFVTCLAAHADTVTFGSFAGPSATGFSNGVITYSNTFGTGPVIANPNGVYFTAFTGTQYVSYTNSNSATSNYTTSYSTSYTGNLAGYSGSISLLADNDATVYLNGFLIGSTANEFLSPTILSIAAGDFLNGVNTFTFSVLNDNTGGPTAFDFSSTATSPAAVASTPEPSSIILLSTAFALLAGMVRKGLVLVE